ncbi:lipoxygenase [Xylariales sp. AK1849]|nr:lipoxygenase [Xylariales sp. AK1849]
MVAELDPSLPLPGAHLAVSDPKDILKQPEEDRFEQVVPIKDAPLQDFDPGVFNEELLNLKIFPDGDEYAGGDIKKGTYAGTQAALTHIYSRIEQSYGSYFDVLAIEPTLPRYMDLSEQRSKYQWSEYPNETVTLKDGDTKTTVQRPAAYPPHLQTVPKEDDVSRAAIFTALGLAESAIILQKVVPDTFLGKTADWLLTKVRSAIEGHPQAGPSIKDVEEYNRYHRKSGTDIARGDNIGLLDDWFSDRRFADQSFTGTNPTTITRASSALIKEYIEAAKAHGYDKWADRLPLINPTSLLVQDCSYFREATGVAPNATLYDKQIASDDNWACASVTLYQLHDDGKLHPIAITIDYKQKMENSVTIFNKRMGPADSTTGEASDWPWRYAKTCAQVSDWLRHEITVHLTNAHFVEEALIVATNRTIPMEHIVYKTLHPHWYKTLSLNAAARDTLVPQIIRDIVGFSPDQTSSYIRHAFETFNFVENYVPNQLKSRGFPSQEDALKDPKYKNYAYAKNMTSMWIAIRTYVVSTLYTYYDKSHADEKVANDTYVADWCKELQTAGYIKTFPTIKTFDQLADAVTMCIHIASPFHSTVNYLQNFYQAFVVAKPSCLCAAPPTSLGELQSYTEKDVVRALPIDRQREWLLTAQVPWLLSYKVGTDRSLLNFALSQWNIYKQKTEPREVEIRVISEKFYQKLSELAKQFYETSKAMDEGSIPYMVMDPGVTAVSILI